MLSLYLFYSWVQTVPLPNKINNKIKVMKEIWLHTHYSQREIGKIKGLEGTVVLFHWQNPTTGCRMSISISA